MAGQGRAAVCYDCVQVLNQLVEEEAPKKAVDRGNNAPLVPRKIYSNLETYVIGQDRAKKILSVAVYNHFKRIWNGKNSSDIELQKTNILLMGPTGCGKTLLAETLARTLDVPFAVCDATSLTESGYVGEDVENILLRLIQAADWDVARAEHGIIYIDELDKIARKEGVNRSITRDVSGEGVQQELLKIIEGCVANVPPQGGRKHPHQEFLQIDTRNVLFICGGAFDGLDDIVSRRLASGSSRLGFLAGGRGGEKEEPNSLSQVAPEDLLQFGFIPEMVGRLPVTVSLDSLDKDSLVRVLTEPKNAIVKQYQQLFSMDGVELEFTSEGLEAAAERALEHQTGARSLRYIIEETLLDVMYELPSLTDVARCIVGREAVEGSEDPVLIGESGEPLSISLGLVEKSA
jgi:ATP-dependent Clp protease ATP-binding subunit ClpX